MVPTNNIKNLFTFDAMWSMCSVENELIRVHPAFATACCGPMPVIPPPVDDGSSSADGGDEKCKLSWSLANVVAYLNHRRSCEDIQPDDVENARQLLQECAPYYEIGALSGTCFTPECQSVPVKCQESATAIHRIFHHLTPSSFVQEAKQGTFQLDSSMVFLPIQMFWHFDELWDIFMDVFKDQVVTDGNTKVEAQQFGMKFDLFATYLQSDTLYLALGALVVVIIIIVYVGSPFLTAMTLLNMIMSLVLAYFAYKVIFQLAFFPFVNIAAAVLVIGIGADDTFVYYDIWKKARKDLSNEHGEYNRAAVVHETLRHASITMFVTSFTTGSALYASAVSSITAVKCFAIYAGTAIVANFIFTVTWLPVVVIIDDMCRGGLSRVKKSNSDQNVIKRSSPTEFISDGCSIVSSAITKFFIVHLQTIVFKLRLLWIVIFLGMAVCGLYVMFVSPKLQLPMRSDFQVLISTHPFEKYSMRFKDHYNFEQDKVDMLPYSVVWGVKAVDNGNHWDPDKTGSVIYDDTFDIADPRSQEWLYDFCQEMRNQTFVTPTGQSYCFIEILREKLQEPCRQETDGSVPYGLPAPCCGRNDFPFAPDIFHKCSALTCQHGGCSVFNGFFKYGPWFKDGKIAALSVVASSTQQVSLDYNKMDGYWKSANTWTRDKIKSAPSGLSGGWFLSQSLMQLQFYDLQGSLATGAPAAMGISLSIAAAVLLITTRNVLISLYAILSISGAVFVTIGSLVLLGWELNIFESAILSLAVGLSVDFTIHYGVAYRLAPSTDRKRRTEYAVETLLPAISVAALSTFSAGAMMMPSTVITYVQLGTFLMLVMTVSWSFATFFFLAVCRTIGPHGDIGQVPSPKCFKCSDNSTDPNETRTRDHNVENGHVVEVAVPLNSGDCHGNAAGQQEKQKEEENAPDIVTECNKVANNESTRTDDPTQTSEM